VWRLLLSENKNAITESHEWQAMIFLTLIEDLYFMGHCSRQIASELLFIFNKDFLPENTLQHIRSLPVVAGSKKTNQPWFLETHLTSRQDNEVAVIFKKLYDEKRSDYLFSQELQKTYLVELIHLITKIHKT